MHGLKNPKHEPVLVVVPKSRENGTGLCQKSVILAREKSSVPESPDFRAAFQNLRAKNAGFPCQRLDSRNVSQEERVVHCSKQGTCAASSDQSGRSFSLPVFSPRSCRITLSMISGYFTPINPTFSRMERASLQTNATIAPVLRTPCKPAIRSRR